MHNCRLTRDVLIDFTLGEMSPAQTSELLAELNDCAACQAEYATLKNTLRVSEQALRATLPAEEFWPGYHARLQGKLIQHLQQASNPASSSVHPARLSFSRQLWIGLRKMATTSVRVPVPAALAMMLLASVLFFSLRSQGQGNVTPPTPTASVETRTVEVPVIQERVVTQVVYVEKKARRPSGPSGLPGSLDREVRNAANATANGAEASGKTAMSLVGFKPTDQVKLTIIKGSYQDEK